MQNTDYKAAFTLMNLVFLKLYAHHFQLDFKMLYEKKNVIIPMRFYLQPLSKNYEYIW